MWSVGSCEMASLYAATATTKPSSVLRLCALLPRALAASASSLDDRSSDISSISTAASDATGTGTGAVAGEASTATSSADASAIGQGPSSQGAVYVCVIFLAEDQETGDRRDDRPSRRLVKGLVHTVCVVLCTRVLEHG